ncbi:MAG: ABC transporter permease, partial [Planctomycetales bacterium]|nr:ABC transporter permease [Planctomycetales bacterium]
ISVGEAKKRPGRAILTLLSVVIGVATVVAVSFAMKTTRTAYQKMYQAVSGRAALEVTAAAGGGFDNSVLSDVRQTPGVKTAVPLIQRPMLLSVGDQSVRAFALGIEPGVDKAVRDYELAAGEFFVEGQGVVLDTGFAESLGAKVGDPITMLVRRGRSKSKIVGLVRPTGVSTAAQGPIVMMPIDAAESRFVTRGKIDSVQIVLADDAREEQVASAIAARLPVGLEVHVPSQRSRVAEETMTSIEHALMMSREFSMLAAVFIIMNTFFMSLSERRRHLAIMRAIGATRWQLSWMLLREALALGVVGTLLGCATGTVVAEYLNRGMGQLFQAQLPPLELTLAPYAWGAACGLGISLVGVIAPAAATWRLTPLEGMRPVVQSPSAR